jgi:hypothetical protein
MICQKVWLITFPFVSVCVWGSHPSRRAGKICGRPFWEIAPSVPRDRSFHAVYLNDESVWSVKAQEGHCAAVQIFDQR